METESGAPAFPKARLCGIAAKLGYTVVCPVNGCALLVSLGHELPADSRAVCPIEELAHDDNVVVLWTLDELRREMQRDADTLRHVPGGAADVGHRA